jgi:7-cyano-7-deazaguanine synthase
MTKKLVLILSGGMDSFTLLHHAISKDIEVDCVTFDYGQRHVKEIICAQKICKELKINNLKIQIPNVDAIFGNSALTDDQVEVPHGSYKSESMQSTIVPNRNMLFISYAISYAVSQDINTVWYGAHAGDHFIYPDCRPEFLSNMHSAAQTCHTYPINVDAPFVDLTKGEIVKIGLTLGVDYSKTWTCYEGQERACGQCGSCNERLEAFAINNLTDPLLYKN